MTRLLISLCLGYLLGLCSLYSALRVGFNVGVAFLTVLCWAALDRVLTRCFSSWQRGDAHEYACSLSLTSSMSYGSATVIATALAAVLLEGSDPPLWAMIAWVAGMCCLGTCFALPLSESMLARYPFPSGQVAGQLVANLQGRPTPAFFPAFALAGLWVGLRERLGIPAQVIWRGQSVLELSPLLVGLGALLGAGLTSSMLAGALVFAIVPSYLPEWEPHVLWFAVGMIVSATLYTFARQWRGSESTPTSNLWGTLNGELGLGLVVGCLLLMLAYSSGWKISPLWLLVLIPLQFLFSYISGVATGQTDVVPTGALGKLALLTFSLAGQGGGAMVHTGTLAGCAAASADFLTDLRCGRELGCPPQLQYRYQLLGALIGPLLFVPTFLWWTRDKLGSAAFPVPAARIWLGVAGLADALSSHGLAIAAGAVVGLVGQIFEEHHTGRKTLLRVLPFAMAAMLDVGSCAALALGGLIAHAASAEKHKALYGALICGEAVTLVLLNL